MNTALLCGTVIVNLALLAYSLGVFFEQRRKRIDALVAVWLSIGLTLDITATIFMILGSPNGPVTAHGLLGYSALAVMLVDTILVVRVWRRSGQLVTPPNLHLYTRVAYAWWVIAYLAGLVMVMSKRM